MKLANLLGIAVALAALAGCSSNYNSANFSDMPIKTNLKAVENYQVGAGDVLEVRVWRAPELSVTSPIRVDGKLAMPLIGTMDVEGLTPEEIKIMVEGKLEEYVASPEVTVIANSPVSYEFTNRVRVTGAVGSQVSINWREDMTVLDLVLLAGGPNEFANPQKAILYRKTGEGAQAYPVYLDDILYGGLLETNYQLMPADILTVPESLF